MGGQSGIGPGCDGEAERAADREAGHHRKRGAVERLADEVIEIPWTIEPLQPILAVVPTQLLAYHIALRRGCDVDQPRNLAKSVTVE